MKFLILRSRYELLRKEQKLETSPCANNESTQRTIFDELFELNKLDN